MINEEVMKEYLVELFTNSQKTTVVHQKNAIILKEYYESDNELFWECLKNIINCLITTEKTSQYLENSIDFFAKFCSLLPTNNKDDDTECMDHPLFRKIFSHLLKTSGLVSDTMRLRSCQIINKIFNNLIGVDLSQELFDDIEMNLLDRLQDPKSSIRQQAVATLHWLQDPRNPQDVIIPQFLNLMNTDPFARVRLLCIEKIAPRKDVVVCIINRINDVDVNVRFSAYKRLSTLPGFLKISEKRRIIECGFSDFSEKIKEFVNKTLLSSWLSHYDNDVLKLMKSLRLDADERDIEHTSKVFKTVLGALFKEKPLSELSAVIAVNERKLIPIENLNWELASYWMNYVQYLSQEEEFEDELSKNVPELTFFCKYVKEYYASMPKHVTSNEFLEHQFILKQFFQIIKTYDFSDPTCRTCLNALVCNILQNKVLTTDVIEMVISSLECSIPEVKKRTQFVCEIISDILYPMNTDEYEKEQKEKDFQISRSIVKLENLKADLEMCITEHKFIEADRLQNEIAVLHSSVLKLKEEPLSSQQNVEKKTDILTTIKCLDIAAGILLSPQVTSLTTSLKALKENFINELLMSEIDSIRVKALRCYGLCCIIDKESSVNGIHIFCIPIFAYRNGEECDTQTLLICIGAVIDLLRIYGPHLVASTKKDELSESMDENHEVIFAGGTALTDVLQGLVDLMDDEQYSIQCRAAFGLCQLVLSERIVSSSLIARLILKWCNPATEDENDEVIKMKHMIAYTLQKIPLMPQFSETLQEAIIITIKALFSAPRVSPLADVNIENIAKFMFALCKTSHDADHIHSNLARTICGEMRDKPKSRINTIYSKLLLYLDIPNNKILISDLVKLCDQIRDNISDRLIVKNIQKFTTALNFKYTQDEIIETVEEELDKVDNGRDL